MDKLTFLEPKQFQTHNVIHTHIIQQLSIGVHVLITKKLICIVAMYRASDILVSFGYLLLGHPNSCLNTVNPLKKDSQKIWCSDSNNH